jgi:hypothetical protein
MLASRPTRRPRGQSVTSTRQTTPGHRSGLDWVLVGGATNLGHANGARSLLSPGERETRESARRPRQTGERPSQQRQLCRPVKCERVRPRRAELNGLFGKKAESAERREKLPRRSDLALASVALWKRERLPEAVSTRLPGSSSEAPFRSRGYAAPRSSRSAPGTVPATPNRPLGQPRSNAATP